MPLMKTETIRLHKADFIRKIFWTGKGRGSFYITLPAYIKAVIDKKQAAGDTIAECVEDWDRLIGLYNDANTKKRQVLVYKYQSDGKIEPGKLATDDDYGEDMDLSVSFSVSFWVGVEINVAGGKNYLDRHGNSKSVWESDRYDEDRDHVIDWTQDREDFFEGLVKTVTQARKRADKFFKQSRKKILAQLDGHAKLLTFQK